MGARFTSSVAPIVGLQGSRTSVPAVARTVAGPPTVSRDSKTGYFCRREIRLPDFDDDSDIEGSTVDAPYFLRSMPLPLNVLRVSMSPDREICLLPQFRLR